MLIDKTLTEFAAVVKSDAPAPGGGSVSAYAGSLGAALTKMVGALTFGKKAFEELDGELQEKMKSAAEEVDKLQLELEKIVDEDTNAFDEVVAGFKMPKDTDEEKAARSKAIQDGYKTAIAVPLRCAKTCLRVLELQKDFAESGNSSALSDVGVGALLAHAGCEGAILNVMINLGSLKDQDYKNDLTKEVKEIMEKATGLKEGTMEVVYDKLNS